MGGVNDRDLASADWSFATFRAYVGGPLERFGADPRVSIWDLCNEPHAREDIETLERHGIGWIVWQLVEGRFITGNKERTDNNALDFMEGFMPFILADGSMRPRHERPER